MAGIVILLAIVVLVFFVIAISRNKDQIM